MICYLEYGTGATQVHLDLAGTDFSIESIEAGAFATPSQELTQTIVRVAIQGRPNIYAATATLGDIINQVQVSEGRTIGDEVYFYYQPANQSTVWRGRVKGLAFAPAPGSGEYWKVSRFVRGEITVIHTIWEGDLTTLPLTNMHATDETTGLQIDTTQDATHSNEALINGEDVTGDAPTPAMIIMEKTGGASDMTKFFIGLNVYSNPNNFQQVYEIEDAKQIGGVTANTNFVSALYSGGEYQRLTGINVGSEAWVDIEMSAAQLGYAAGNQFHVILRGGLLNGDEIDECYYYLAFAISAFVNSVFWLSEPIFIDEVGVIHLGIMRLPPWRVEAEGVDVPYCFHLSLISVDGVGKGVNLDAVHFWPVDGYREIETIAFLQIDTGERVVDDMIEDSLYSDTGDGTGQNKMLVALGGTINLVPGRDQKLYFITIPYTIGYTMDVIVKYRPRRLSL